MSAITQEPIFETVCTASERRIVGYRDATGEEQALEEQFSSGVPSVIGETLDTAALSWPNGAPPPGFVVGGRLPPSVDPAPPVPIPGAAFLLLGALALAWVARQFKRQI